MGVRRVQSEDIIKMNELYLIEGTYAAVARKTGFSPGTVKKYIVENFVAEVNINTTPFDSVIAPAKEIILPTDSEGWLKFLHFTEEDKIECDELRKEILL